MSKIKYVGTADAARILGIRRDSVRRLTQNGVLPDIRNIKGHRLFDKAVLKKRLRKSDDLLRPAK